MSERVGGEFLRGVMAGRNAAADRLYVTIDQTLEHLADQLAEGKVSAGEYKLMEAIALYILNKTREVVR